jgi:phosphoribosylanthranilate isomerase
MLPTRNPRVKVCCIRSVQEAWTAIETGASAVGLVSQMPSGPGVIDEETIREIAARVPPPVASFLLTSLTDPDAIVAQHARCRTSTIQICDYLEPGAHDSLRRRLPGVRLVQVIHVRTWADVERAISVAAAVDAILLDSGNPRSPVKQLGGTGCTHDWGLSLAIREKVEVPVFLAGGLSSVNAAAAVRDVGPFGLDLCSGVRTDDRLDPAKLSAFFAALRAATNG